MKLVDLIRSLQTVLSVMVLAALLSACTTARPIEVDVYETKTESLLDRVDFELLIGDVVLLNPYLEQASPRVDEFNKAREDLALAAGLLVDYSLSLLEVVRDGSDEDSVRRVIQLFESLHAGLLDLPIVAQQLEGFDPSSVLKDVATQKSFTPAMRTLRPATHSVASALTGSVDATTDLYEAAYGETYDKIINEYRAFNAYADVMVLRRNEIMEELLLVESARGGDRASWQTLMDYTGNLKSSLEASASGRPEDIDAAENFLLGRLDKLAATWSNMEPSYEIYQATLRELYEVDSSARSVLKIANYIIQEWEREQRELAAGRPAALAKVSKDLAYLALKRATR